MKYIFINFLGETILVLGLMLSYFLNCLLGYFFNLSESLIIRLNIITLVIVDITNFFILGVPLLHSALPVLILTVTFILILKEKLLLVFETILSVPFFGVGLCLVINDYGL